MTWPYVVKPKGMQCAYCNVIAVERCALPAIHRWKCPRPTDTTGQFIKADTTKD